jgi:hypothetical protein
VKPAADFGGNRCAYFWMLRSLPRAASRFPLLSRSNPSIESVGWLTNTLAAVLQLVHLVTDLVGSGNGVGGSRERCETPF